MKTTTPKSVKIGRFMHFPTTLNIGCRYLLLGAVFLLAGLAIVELEDDDLGLDDGEGGVEVEAAESGGVLTTSA